MMSRIFTYTWLGLVAAGAVLATGCASKAQREAKLEASAQAFMDQARYPEAIIQYRNALSLAPTAATLEFKLGQAYAKNLQYQDAFLAYNKAVALQHDYPAAQLAVGEIYLVSKQYDRAAGNAQAVLSKHPSDPEATILQANVEAAQGKVAAAEQALEALLKVRDESVPAHLTLGIYFAASKRYDDAKLQFQRAIQLDPHSAPARNDMASLLIAQGDLTGA
ncbi:MAG: tetratricopeptide repeat protein, partial [Terriglobales bacterium]